MRRLAAGSVGVLKEAAQAGDAGESRARDPAGGLLAELGELELQQLQ